MKIKILGVRDGGVLSKERVVLLADADGNVGHAMLAATRSTAEQTISSKISTPFWFPDREVKKGDLLVVYTQAGTPNQIKNKDQTSSHFFYAGLPSALYGDKSMCAVLFDILTWTVSSDRY